MSSHGNLGFLETARGFHFAPRLTMPRGKFLRDCNSATNTQLELVANRAVFSNERYLKTIPLTRRGKQPFRYCIVIPDIIITDGTEQTRLRRFALTRFPGLGSLDDSTAPESRTSQLLERSITS